MNLIETADDDRLICIEIQGGIYGLPQAGILDFNDLEKHLAPHGYEPAQHAPGPWMSKEQNITFSLVVDNFRIKCNSLNNLQHLINSVKAKHTITVDMTGNSHTGVTLK